MTSFYKKALASVCTAALIFSAGSCTKINESEYNSMPSSTVQSEGTAEGSQSGNIGQNSVQLSRSDAVIAQKTPYECAQTAKGKSCKVELDEAFFEWFEREYSDCTWKSETSPDEYAYCDAFITLIDSGYSVSGALYMLTNKTALVLYDIYTGNSQAENYIDMGPDESDSAELVFGGDFCLADNYTPMQHLAENNIEITDAIDKSLVDMLINADVSMLNNEFTISDKGSPMPGKIYTFVSKTSNTALYNLLGIDIVLLANNHCYDYGEEAFFDTLSTLREYNIKYVGAGENIEEAKQPVYYTVNGMKIAYVAATRAEKYILTPEAAENSGGVLRTYDSAAYCEVIENAESCSDFVVASVHWGTEDTNVLEDVQIEMGHQYIDSGADIVIGTHAHCLQGVEFYNGKPIFYNLGNFWFNAYNIDTGLLEVKITSPESAPQLTFVPCIQRYCETRDYSGTDEGIRILEYMESISINAHFAQNGLVTEISE